MLRMNRHLARAKRAAEESNRMKGIFIRNITHEINTPLNSIVGFAELAAASDDADAAERQSYKHHPGKQRLSPKTRGRRALHRRTRIVGNPAGHEPDRHQRMLPGVYSEGLTVQFPGGEYPFCPGTREIPPAHFVHADIQKPSPKCCAMPYISRPTEKSRSHIRWTAATAASHSR